MLHFKITLCYDEKMKENGVEKTVYDVVVIGGGPSGMMAAGSAGAILKKTGGKVLLLEKNSSLGKKLRITGGGRCNLTNHEFDNKIILKKFKEAEPFLYSPFSRFNVRNTLKFFESRGMKTKVEAEGRVFPESDSAESVWNTLSSYLKEHNVITRLNTNVKGFKTKNQNIESVILENGEEIKALAFILATGGMSRPETGSTGDGFSWLKEIGHNIFENKASLVPISVKDTWVKELSGVSLSGTKISLFQNNTKKQVVKNTDTRKTKLLFTHEGLSGPTILNMSRDIGDMLPYGEVTLSLDLLPEDDFSVLEKKLQELLKSEHKKKIKNALDTLIPSSLVTSVLAMSEIDGELFCNGITREARIRLGQKIKDMRITVTGLFGVEKAIVTSGGLDLKEVDFKTMKSKLYGNLFVSGDILNIDRPSGGYSLQLCWTTGFIAGEESGKKATSVQNS